MKITSDMKWRAENDMRTLREAEEIKADGKRVEAARKAADEQIETLKAVMKVKSSRSPVGKRLANRKL